MTQSMFVTGPVKVIVKGKQGTGKSRVARIIAEALVAHGISTVSYDGETPKKERKWRAPYAPEKARVMIVEKQSERPVPTMFRTPTSGPEDFRGRITDIVGRHSQVNLEVVIRRLGLNPENAAIRKAVKYHLRQLGWYETRREGEGRMWRRAETGL